MDATKTSMVASTSQYAMTTEMTGTTRENDEWLRDAFDALVSESAELPPDQRLIMYDAVDESEVRELMGLVFRKRLDARRNTKPKKSDDQLLVCTPFNPNGFHFGKIQNERERIVKLQLSASSSYSVLTNKFPLFPRHMLLTADALVPQQMNATHLRAICELQRKSSFCAYFNSWCASASINHFHVHLIDEFPPVTSFPLIAGPLVMGVRCLQPEGFPGFCYVFPKSAALPIVDTIISAMQVDNQPHNLLFTPRFIYVFPKPHVRPARSFELYPETVGGPELIGSFTVYNREVYDGLQLEHIAELCRINTAPLPSCVLLMPASSSLGDEAAVVGTARAHDDLSMTETATVKRARLGGSIPMVSVTTGMLPSLPLQRTRSEGMPSIPLQRDRSLHMEDWPHVLPIARALNSNINKDSIA
jgi:ATP adenylyltransferase/5',5'''-P-1,P-4-tetraphosphate phosphorylase II